MVTLTSIAILSGLLFSGVAAPDSIATNDNQKDIKNNNIVAVKSVDMWADNSIGRSLTIQSDINSKSHNSLKKAKSIVFLETGESGEIMVSAYSSTPDQTDDSPFIMASGRHVYNGAIAANFLPLGSKVRFPDLYGDKVFTVEDRMNKRYQYKMDIWMETRQQALNFGLRKLKYEVVKESSNQVLASAK